MKKTWNTPQLTQLGAVEELTQNSPIDLQKLGQFVLPQQGFGLLASLEI